jgi:hypothetical protein
MLIKGLVLIAAIAFDKFLNEQQAKEVIG